MNVTCAPVAYNETVPAPIDLRPGDVIQLTRHYHDGVDLIFGEGSIAFVIAIFTDLIVKNPKGVSRAPDRILLMPAGELRILDLQQWWVRSNCKRLTKWTTEV